MSKPEIGKAKTKKKTSDHGNKESPDPMTRWVADLLNTQPFEKVKKTTRRDRHADYLQ